MHELTDKIINYLFSTKYLSGGVYSDLSKYSINDIIENWMKEKAVEIASRLPHESMELYSSYKYNRLLKLLGIKEESLEDKFRQSRTFLVSDSCKDLVEIAKQHFKDHPEQLED